jgi:hypothetical protein
MLSTHTQTRLFSKNKHHLHSAEHMDCKASILQMAAAGTVSSKASYRTNIRRAPHQHRLNILTTSVQIGPDSSFLRVAYIQLYRTAYNFARLFCVSAKLGLTY